MKLSILYESKTPEFKILKKHRIQLDDDERAKVMKAGAIWHHGPNGEPSPAIWKSKINGKIWYICNTHRCMAAKTTLDAILKEWPAVEDSA
jgi:hypothetical protein